MSNLGTVPANVSAALAIIVAIVSWVQAWKAKNSATEAKQRAAEADERAERSATAAERSADAAERADQRQAIQAAREAERNDVVWVSGWVSANLWAVTNLGLDDACNVIVQVEAGNESWSSAEVLTCNPSGPIRGEQRRVEFDLAEVWQRGQDEGRRQTEAFARAGIAAFSSGNPSLNVRCHWETPMGTPHTAEFKGRLTDPMSGGVTRWSEQ